MKEAPTASRSAARVASHGAATAIGGKMAIVNKEDLARDVVGRRRADRDGGDL
jgi:hypothetical protein